MSATTAVAPSVHEELLDHSADEHASRRVVVVAIDGSDRSQQAVDWAIDNILRAAQDSVVLINVRPLAVQLGYPTALGDFGAEYQSIEDANREASHELIRKTAKKFVEKDIPIRGIALRGDAREELVAKIDELKAQLVIIGSRGLNTVSRALIGSVSDYVVHHSSAPVIVTKF
ncbi:uncharacterized protein BJ171DRAFT_558772 [Polychytrium aggregatum]|uniref:uncharacterized protein n=1 Tax=Polychytrium aggregatum TaxID=110093 RepID=UPI0022FF00F3|nr:uncharacterized protein BJ171DRAFT_558772 [Polychytrium aggregatum]KAI9204035.1 hypothetical protein BJ171DRAFT_558772 [Polychytrium aggregatum]